MSLTIFNSIEKLKQDTTCLQYLNKDQKNFILNNKDIILDIIKHNVNIIKYISSDMIDKDIMLAAVANTPNALMFANDSFLDDEDIILEAIKKEAKSLLFASDNLKAKKSFFNEAGHFNSTWKAGSTGNYENLWMSCSANSDKKTLQIFPMSRMLFLNKTEN